MGHGPNFAKLGAKPAKKIARKCLARVLNNSIGQAGPAKPFQRAQLAEPSQQARQNEAGRPAGKGPARQTKSAGPKGPSQPSQARSANRLGRPS